MRHITRIVLPAVVAVALLNVASPAQAGEPFHPFYQPIVDFFNFFWLF